MATGIVTEAVQAGQSIRVSVAVDEAGTPTLYTAEVLIADLKALPTNAARKQALLDAVTAERNRQLEIEALNAQLETLIGDTVTV